VTAGRGPGPEHVPHVGGDRGQPLAVAGSQRHERLLQAGGGARMPVGLRPQEPGQQL
jgi:hypothetical protein